ncbi:MAG: CRISPR-associated ring nuclease Crn3/Csx3 [Cyanophyceae cyanobacterium]
MTAIELNLSFRQQEGITFQRLSIRLTAPDGLIEPQDLAGLTLPKGVQWTQGIVLEGRAPIWLYGYLVHICHAAAWVGCYDPRLGGAVVVESHVKGMAVGRVLKVSL